MELCVYKQSKFYVDALRAGVKVCVPFGPNEHCLVHFRSTGATGRSFGPRDNCSILMVLILVSSVKSALVVIEDQDCFVQPNISRATLTSLLYLHNMMASFHLNEIGLFYNY